MKIKESGKKIILFVLVLGIYLFLLLLFEPCFKVDDLYMNDIMVGTFSGTPDYHFIYGNFLVGLFVSKMTFLFPKVAWLACIQVLLLLLALYFAVLLFFNNRQQLYILIPSICIYEYLFMIKITFTQTAAVCVTTGLLMMLYYIQSGQKKHLIGAGSFVFCGLIFRIQALSMCIPFFALALFFCLLLFYSRYPDKEKRVEVKVSIYRVTVSCVVILTIFLVLPYANKYVYEKDAIWEKYLSENSIKSYFTDYNNLDYLENKEEFEAIGISENDFLMLSTNNLYYKESWYSDSIQKAYKYIRDKNTLQPSIVEVFDINRIVIFSKEFIIKYLSYTHFMWCVFIICITIRRSRKGLKLFIFLNFVLLFCLNYYLYIRGRVFQPHVDIGLVYCWFIVFLYVNNSDNENNNEIIYIDKKYNAIILSLFLCIILKVNINRTVFLDYGDDYSANPSYSFGLLDRLENDKNHLYISTARESVYSLWDEKVFQGGLTGTKSNLFFTSQYLWPSCREVLERYGIENPLEEMVDSDTIRFFISDSIETEQVEMIENYLKEHVDENSKMVKIEEYKTINIYRCVTRDNY